MNWGNGGSGKFYTSSLDLGLKTAKFFCSLEILTLSFLSQRAEFINKLNTLPLTAFHPQFVTRNLINKKIK